MRKLLTRLTALGFDLGVLFLFLMGFLTILLMYSVIVTICLSVDGYMSVSDWIQRRWRRYKAAPAPE